MNDPGGSPSATVVGLVPQVSEDEAGLAPMVVAGILRKVYVKSRFGWVSTGLILQTM